MIKLSKIFDGILKEQQAEEPLEYPKVNIVVSKFPKEKKILFAPLDKNKPSHRIRSIINQVKEKFQVKSAQKLDNDVFELVLDPVSDFLAISDYLDSTIVD